MAAGRFREELFHRLNVVALRVPPLSERREDIPELAADLLTLAPAGKIPRIEEIHIDRWVIAFTFGVSVLTGIVFGLAPAFDATRRELRESLSQGARTATAR